MFRSGGPAGNRTAVHTEDVLATATETYDYWTAALGIARGSWPNSYWGENLTVVGIDESQLRIGDRLRIGAQAVLEVTSPRIPCFKLAWRLGQLEPFLRTLVQSGHTGFYLRVLVPGMVSAGDRITVERAHPDNVTVAELSRLLHDESAEIDRLRRALVTPGLGNQASSMLRNRVTHLTDRLRSHTGKWPGWRDFVVTEVAKHNAEICSFTLCPTDGEVLPEPVAGQFLTLCLRMPDGREVIRPWSISDYSDHARSYRVTVRRNPRGTGSRYLHSTKVGDVLQARSPAGGFVLDRGAVYRVVLISAGIGLTPLLSMLKAHAAREQPPPLMWIHTARNGATHALRAEVECVVRSRTQFRSYVAYSAPRDEDHRGVDYDHSGRIPAERYIEILAPPYACSPFGREIELPGYASMFYICGPAAFEESVRGALTQFGVTPASIFSESFGRARYEQSVDVRECIVHFTKSNRTVTWGGKSGDSLLELAERHGLTPPSNCRAGTCGTCGTAMTLGQISYSLKPTIEPAPGHVLICCAKPSSAHLELDL